MKRNFLLITLLVLPLVSNSAEPETVSQFSFTEEQVQLASEIIAKLESNHLVKKEYQDIKEEAVEVFINRLDPNKNIFTSREVDQFSMQSKKESNIKEDISNAFNLFNK